MSRPLIVHVQLARQVAVEPDAAAELHRALAHARRHFVEPDAARVEPDDAVDAVERVRQRQVADAAVDDRRAAGEHRLVERAVDRRRQLGAARSEHVAGESLQDAEVRVARRLQRDAAIAQGRRAPRAAGACLRRPAAGPARSRRACRARSGSAPRSSARSRTAAGRPCPPWRPPAGDRSRPVRRRRESIRWRRRW